MYPRWTKGVISKNLDSMTPILSPGQPREQYLRILTQWRQYYAVVIIWWNFRNSTFNGEKFKENWIWNAFRIFFLNKWFYMKYIGNYLSVESLFDWYFVKSLGSYISDSLLYEVKTIPRSTEGAISQILDFMMPAFMTPRLSCCYLLGNFILVNTGLFVTVEFCLFNCCIEMII